MVKENIKRKGWLSLLLLFTLLLGAGASYFFYSQQSTDSYSIDKVLSYEFVISNKSADFIKNAMFKAYAPVRQNAYQKVIELTANHDFKLKEDSYGNQLMIFQISELVPYSQKIISVRANIQFSESPNVYQVGEASTYIGSEKYIETNEEKLQKAAEAFKEYSSINELAPSIKNWVYKYLQYSGYVKEDKGALFALEKQVGDCTEFMYLALALLRLNNIPARGVVGVKFKTQSTVLADALLHNWVEYQSDNERWSMMDPQMGLMDEDASQYVVFRVLGMQEGFSLSNTHRFSAFDNRLLVTLR